MMSIFKKNLTMVLSIFSIMAISTIMFYLPACVVSADRGPYRTQEPYSRPGDLRGIEGLWFLTAANVTGKLEFYWAGNAWSGRIWFDAFQQWEPLTDIIFDSRMGEIQFTRPNYGQRYIGTLSGSQLAGTFAYGGQSLPWEASRGATRQGPLVDLHRIQGLWFLTAANVTGKLEFYRAGNVWGGRIWFNAFQQWEPLTDIFFDPRTGELQFTRPNYGQQYIGTLSGNHLVGTFAYGSQSLPWEARRH